MKTIIILAIVAVCAQVVLSSESCGCSRPKPCSSKSQLLSEELIDVDRHHGHHHGHHHDHGHSCSHGINYEGSSNTGYNSNCQECKHFHSRQQNPIVIRQPDQKFILQPAPVNVYPRIHQSSGHVKFSPKIFTKQGGSNVHIKPVVVKVEKEGRSKMVCRHEYLGNDDSSHGGYHTLPYYGSSSGLSGLSYGSSDGLSYGSSDGLSYGSSHGYGSSHHGSHHGSSHGSSCGCGCNK